ncbi:MAG: AmmeMemoRadiSam system protein A [Phycisphaerae bacterium]|nr:AmmeMemoRadiSam system protein A [Phycisphaerae bacterium]
MNDPQKQALLRTAKDAVAASVNKLPPPVAASDDADLLQKQGCFVTLKNAGRLRGCIGLFTSDKPLIHLVAEMASAAATQDPRFRMNRITPAELARLNIEISVLSPLKKTADPLSLRLGVDGIYITQGYQSGCYLPQVAEETGWSKEEFLSSCCSDKAGLAPTAWKDPDTDVYLFSADAFDADYTDI